MEHTNAIRIGAAEKYLLNELDEEQRAEYEEHFFDCQECAEDVKSGAAFAANAKEVLKLETSERSAAHRPAPVRRDWKAIFWPVPLGVAATLALAFGLLAYQAAVVVPGLQQKVAEGEALQRARFHFLSVARGEPQVVKLDKETRMVGLTLSRSSEKSYPYYRTELRDAGGRVRVSGVVPAAARGEELNVAMPATGLAAGSYVLVLQGLDSPAGPVVAPDFARYPFSIERE